MSEKRMWEYLREKIKPFLHVERITERFTEGMPDCVYTSLDGKTGFLELKYLAKMPLDLDHVPLLTYGPHGLQQEQAFWLGRWARHGGRAGVLLRVGSDDWWYWRAKAGVPWTTLIRTTWAHHHATARWLYTNIEEIAQELCI